MSLENTIGYIACANVALLQVPQVYKTYQSKQAEDLSWGMIFLNLFASILWFIYGIILSKGPIIVANWCYFIANVSICVIKRKYKELGHSQNNHINTTTIANI